MLFRQTVCYGILRHLATVCCREFSSPSNRDVMFIMRVRSAVEHVSSEKQYQELRGREKQQAKSWLEELNVQLTRIEQVNGKSHTMLVALHGMCRKAVRPCL